MAQRSGLTRGDRRRNAKIEELRAVVRSDRAILAIDLGEDKQVAALLDHDGRVLGRRVARDKAHALGGLLRWAVEQAGRHGFVGVVVGCEPTGHRWRSVMQLADAAGLGFVCVQSLRVHLARQADDYTRDKTDHKDAVLIGKLIARLDCYLPERAEEDWARLRHLGSVGSGWSARWSRAGTRSTTYCRLLAGGAGVRGQAVRFHDLAGLPERSRWTAATAIPPATRVGPRPILCRGAPRAAPVRRAAGLSQGRRPVLRRPHRRPRRDRSASRRAGAGRHVDR